MRLIQPLWPRFTWALLTHIDLRPDGFQFSGSVYSNTQVNWLVDAHDWLMSRPRPQRHRSISWEQHLVWLTLLCLSGDYILRFISFPIFFFYDRFRCRWKGPLKCRGRRNTGLFNRRAHTLAHTLAQPRVAGFLSQSWNWEERIVSAEEATEYSQQLCAR